MKQYAIWFYSLLEEAYKLEAHNIEMAGTVSLLPYAKDTDRRRFFDNLERAQRDIIDLGKVNDDYSGLESLKKELK